MGASIGQKTSQRRRGNRRRRVPMAEINVTPFVDVMLVLLIVFMVTAPLLTVGIPVDLPKVKSSLFNEYFNPFVMISVAFGKGIKEIILSLQFRIGFFFFAKK